MKQSYQRDLDFLEAIVILSKQFSEVYTAKIIKADLLTEDELANVIMELRTMIGRLPNYSSSNESPARLMVFYFEKLLKDNHDYLMVLLEQK